MSMFTKNMKNIKQELLEIEGSLLEANKAVPDITWNEHHPYYPREIQSLMNSIGKSEWIFREYQKHKLDDVIKNIEQAQIEELQCAFTHIVRSERWRTGAWKEIMVKGTLNQIVARAKQLLTHDNIQY